MEDSFIIAHIYGWKLTLLAASSMIQQKSGANLESTFPAFGDSRLREIRHQRE
jgi:hypothetical protein